MPSTIDILRDTREYLDDPEHWTQRSWRSRYNVVLNKVVDDECFCLAGAVANAGGYPNISADIFSDDPALWGALDVLRDVVINYHGLYPCEHVSDVLTFNDAATHDEVLAALDQAIYQLETVDAQRS